MERLRVVRPVVVALCVGVPLTIGAQAGIAAKKTPTTRPAATTKAAKPGPTTKLVTTTAPRATTTLKPAPTVPPKPFQDDSKPEPLVPNKPAATMDSSVKGAKQLAKGTLDVNGATAKTEYILYTGDRYGSVGPCIAVGTPANYSSGPYNICESDTNLAAQEEWRAFHTEFFVSATGKVAVFMVPATAGLSAVTVDPGVSAKTPTVVNAGGVTAVLLPYEHLSVTAPVKVMGTVAAGPYALGWLTPNVARVTGYERAEAGNANNIKWTHLVRRQPYWTAPPAGDTPVLSDQITDFVEWSSPNGTRIAYAPQETQASKCGPVRRTGSNPVYAEISCDLQAGVVAADAIVGGKTYPMTVARFPSKAVYGDQVIDAGLAVVELVNPPATMSVILKDAAGAQVARVDAKTTF